MTDQPDPGPADGHYWLPGIEPAEPLKFDPAVFSSDDREVDAFVLMLAHAYNDLKAINWCAGQLLRGRRSRTGKPGDPYLGEVIGFLEWTNRQCIALLYELLKLVREAEAARSAETFAFCVRKLPTRTRKKWQAVVDAAADKGGADDPLGTFLARVRNNVAYHYYQPKELLRGYDRHFADRNNPGVNDFAYASIGQTMKLTRFFFADAAAQTYCKMVDQEGVTTSELKQAVSDINEALVLLVGTYLRVRRVALTNAGPRSPR